MDNDDPRLFTEFVEGLNGNQEVSFNKEIYIPIWKEITENVDRFNQPEFLLLLLVMSGLRTDR